MDWLFNIGWISNNSIFITIGAIILILLGIYLAFNKPATSPLLRIKATSLLTHREQMMYRLLQESFPKHLILSQVAFASFMQGEDDYSRRAIGNKVADFVILDSSLKIVAVIELDEHLQRTPAQAEEEKIIRAAGFQLLRYSIPEIEQMRHDLQKAHTPPEQPLKK